jgi:hypothetical protein
LRDGRAFTLRPTLRGKGFTLGGEVVQRFIKLNEQRLNPLNEGALCGL